MSQELDRASRHFVAGNDKEALVLLRAVALSGAHRQGSTGGLRPRIGDRPHGGASSLGG
jgi:hypothetical protein